MKRILTIAIFIVACQPSTTPTPTPSAVVAPQVEAPKMAPAPQRIPLVSVEHPTHQYTKPGTYIVTLTIVDGQGHQAVITQTIKIAGTGRRRAVQPAMGAE